MHKHIHKYKGHKEEMLRTITVLVFATGHVVIAVILNYFLSQPIPYPLYLHQQHDHSCVSLLGNGDMVSFSKLFHFDSH